MFVNEKNVHQKQMIAARLESMKVLQHSILWFWLQLVSKCAFKFRVSTCMPLELCRGCGRGSNLHKDRATVGTEDMLR